MNILDLISEDFDVISMSQNIFSTKQHDSLRIWKDTNSWFWYSMGYGGGPKEWLIKVHNLDEETAKLLAEPYQISIDDKLKGYKNKEKNNIYEPYQISGKNKYVKYFQERNISKETFTYFQLQYDSQLNRAIIPIFSEDNRKIGAIVRKVYAQNKEERYKNILFTGQRPVLWPQQYIHNIKGKVLLFEGCWSVMRWYQVLFPINPTLSFFSIFGTFPTKKVVELLSGLDGIYIILDNDEAGLKLKDLLNKMGIRCNYILPSIYPDEMTDSQILKVYEKYIK